MSTLVIVESPSKAKTIKKYLGKGYDVRASVGHVRDLPKSNKNAVNIEKGFKPHYEIPAKKKDVVKDLKAAAKKADEVILATDPDREGEAIAWHLAEALDLDPKKAKRVSYTEITKSAIEEAFKHPRTIDQNLRKAQEARRVLDRLVGYDLSGLIWKKVRYGLSAGRVQSPALRILMEREREIRAFKPETYWVLEATLATKTKEQFVVTYKDEPRDRKVAEKVLDEAKEKEWQAAEVSEKSTKRAPAPPFTTSTLQQAASTRLGFSPSRTMRAAQKLYEAGHITYMRTDGVTLSTQALAQAAGVIEATFGKEYVNTTQYKGRHKNAQEAHEAVRPSEMKKEAAGADSDQKRLYDLIRKRTLASQMVPAEMLRTRITATPKGGTSEWIANGSRVTFDGWLKAFPEARGDDTLLPKVEEKDNLTKVSVEDIEKETQPPSRYSEAGLVKELEKRGIGRPSTYASIIKTLEDREYVTKEGRTLIPTDTGDVVSTFLERAFKEYISDDFTAKMENELDDIAEGKRGYVETLEEFYTPFTKELKQKDKDTEKLTTLGDVDPSIRCPKCDATMVEKLGRGGIFLSCSRFPECTGLRARDGREIKPDEPIGTDPESGLPIFILDGRFGPYVQLGEKTKEVKKPRRASIPQDVKPEDVTIELALKYLSLPRTLGTHPETGNDIVANVGRFGPYIAHNTEPKPDYRSLKEDDVYTITLERALEILSEPKKVRGGFKKKKK